MRAGANPALYAVRRAMPDARRLTAPKQSPAADAGDDDVSHVELNAA